MYFKTFSLLLCASLFTAGAYADEATRVRCVLSDQAHMHLAPDDSALPWPVRRYTPLLHVDTHGDWHLVRDLDSDLFWIHNRYVTANDYLVCGIVLAEQTEARLGPGEDYEEAGILTRYTGLRIVEYVDGWVRAVIEDGSEVWVVEEDMYSPFAEVSVAPEERPAEETSEG
jgi:SH3-like domain-containing protein